MKKLVGKLAVVAAVLTLGLGFASCGNDVNEENNENNNGNGNGSSNTVTAAQITPKNFTVKQEEGTNYLIFDYEPNDANIEGVKYWIREITDPSTFEYPRTHGSFYFDDEFPPHMKCLLDDKEDVSGRYTFKLMSRYSYEDESRFTRNIDGEPLTATVDFVKHFNIPENVTFASSVERKWGETDKSGMHYLYNKIGIDFGEFEEDEYTLLTWCITNTNECPDSDGWRNDCTVSVNLDDGYLVAKYKDYKAPEDGDTLYVWVRPYYKEDLVKGPFTFQWDANYELKLDNN